MVGRTRLRTLPQRRGSNTANCHTSGTSVCSKMSSKMSSHVCSTSLPDAYTSFRDIFCALLSRRMQLRFCVGIVLLFVAQAFPTHTYTGVQPYKISSVTHTHTHTHTHTLRTQIHIFIHACTNTTLPRNMRHHCLHSTCKRAHTQDEGIVSFDVLYVMRTSDIEAAKNAGTCITNKNNLCNNEHIAA
jgi:hypothetical protein